MRGTRCRSQKLITAPQLPTRVPSARQAATSTHEKLDCGMTILLRSNCQEFIDFPTLSVAYCLPASCVHSVLITRGRYFDDLQVYKVSFATISLPIGVGLKRKSLISCSQTIS